MEVKRALAARPERRRCTGKRMACIVLLSLVAGHGCRTGRDYSEVEGPRFAGGPAGRSAPPARDTLRIVSFNIEYAREMDSALVVMRLEPRLRVADILLLQEMDEEATKRVAAAFDMWYVYYPAIFNNRIQRDFGNAVLSRWPIHEDAKLALPHASRYAGTHRIATAASIRVGDAVVRVYSTHLGTLADIGSRARHDQLRTILADAEGYDRVIIGGDMNDAQIGSVARELGYVWPTENGPRTTTLGRLDHILLKGLGTPAGESAGTVKNNRRSSDHLPVWATAVISSGQSAAQTKP